MIERALAILAAALALTASAGCWRMPKEPQTTTPPAAPGKVEAPYLRKAAVDYRSGPDGKGDNAVESALILSEKYSQAMEKILQIQGDKRDLEQKNKKLLEQVAQGQMKLAQCEKELSDANELLIEMRKDLDHWKTNVLGFRQEIRAAQRAQLDATAKVIRLLGGQWVEPTTRPSSKQAVKTDETASKAGS